MLEKWKWKSIFIVSYTVSSVSGYVTVEKYGDSEGFIFNPNDIDLNVYFPVSTPLRFAGICTSVRYSNRTPNDFMLTLI